MHSFLAKIAPLSFHPLSNGHLAWLQRIPLLMLIFPELAMRALVSTKRDSVAYAIGVVRHALDLASSAVLDLPAGAVNV
jgi:hypothetical protein